MKAVKFKGNVTDRERQMIQAILWNHGQALMSSFGIERNTSGLLASEYQMVAQLTKEFGEKSFPDLTFWVE